MNSIESILNSACGPLNQHLREKTVKKKVVKARNDCPEVQWIHWQLKYWCEEKKLTLIPELKFSKKRKFRFDFAIKELKIAIEYEGIFSNQSRHTNKIGYSKDTDKYRLAAMEGWTVLRYTKINYHNVISDVENYTSLIKASEARNI